MCRRTAIRQILPIVILVCSATLGASGPFTAKDDVGLALFEYAGQGAPGGVIKYSPDGRYFAVLTERGRLDLNAPEDTLWVFSTAEVLRFVQHPDRAAAPVPVALAQMATEKDGPLIEHVHWLQDSSGIAFTTPKKNARCKYHQLFVANVKTHALTSLTPEEQDVGDFDIRSETRYIYEVSAPHLLTAAEDLRPAVAVTGKNFWSIVFPNDQPLLSPFEAAGLWAAIDGERRQVLPAKSYESSYGEISLSLSPDGRSAVAIIKAEHPPANWSRYQAPPGYDKLNMPLDTAAYHLIDLKSGARKLLVNAPSGLNQDWHSYMLVARWSADGQSLLLPDTFFPLDVSDPNEIADRESHPYIAVLRLKTGQLSGVLAVRAGLDKLRYAVLDARFEGDDTVVVDFDRSGYLPQAPPSAVFRQQGNGGWRQVAGAQDPRLAALPIKLQVRESINEPPALTARDKASGTSRLIWDPNPQLQGVELGSGEVIHWKDDNGYEWEAGLVKPPDYTPGKRYPLVIQTHGFVKHQFLSNGIFTSAFAARPLAAVGIVVVQMSENPNALATEREGPDQVAGFRSLAKKLTGEGIIDPAKVGAIGFSRTVYHVLFTLTADPPLLAAASVTDGVTLGYFEYIFSVDQDFDREADAINGGKPFDAEGLKNWLAHSPEFNMDKVRAPLLLLQPGPESAFADWEPYAALRYLKKPVDLIMLQRGSHVMTNPIQRLAAETSNVEWFRFWLQGYEDPAAEKGGQYRRWEKLCDLQVAQNPNQPAFCVRTKTH